MVSHAVSSLVLGACTLLVLSSHFTAAVPAPAVPWLHRQTRHSAPAALHQTPQLQELDPVDKCLFTCDYCYKQAKVLLACANECIVSMSGDGAMGRMWLDTCPFFGQPIYFDYQPV